MFRNALALSITKTAILLGYTQWGSSDDIALLMVLLPWRVGYYHSTSFLLSRWRMLVAVTALALAALAYFLMAQLRDEKEISLTRLSLRRPVLFSCRITHSGLLPGGQALGYSRYFIGVPVGRSGVASRMVSVDRQAESMGRCFAVDAADHFAQGHEHLGLRGKLDSFLESEGLDTTDYPFAYLVTTPRVMGFQCQPMSIWYLYSAEKRLIALITEVNNVFQQQRLCFLDPRYGDVGDRGRADRVLDARASTGLPQRGFARQGPDTTPFESQAGAYRLVASNPLSPNMEGLGLIDNTIRLISSSPNAKHVDRIFSNHEPIDISGVSFLKKLGLLLRWWWTELIAFLQVQESVAAVSGVQKSQDWHDPGASGDSTCRNGTREEHELELVFRNYLRYLVKQSPSSLRVRYVPGGVYPALNEQILSGVAERGPETAENLEFKVLTPTFYSRFVYYAHDFEAMFCELNESRTIWLSNPRLLPKLVLKKPAPPLITESYLDYSCFSAIKKLRKRPPAPGQVAAAQAPRDIRDFRLSSMDGYVLSNEGTIIRRRYERNVLKLFIADRVAWGSMRILRLETLLLRLLIASMFVLL